MLRITKSRSASAAKAYFREALQSADYYLEGRDVVGLWRGLGAARLGLVGDVAAAEFTALLDNRTPDGARLTARDRPDRIPGFDFTANAPKSVSLLWAVTRDERVLEAHKRAVGAMMAEVERNLEARVRTGRNARSEAVRKTGEAIWAEFQHDTARPVDGMPDPHLHTHCYLINATFDAEEARWKAAQIGNIAADRVYFEAVYQSTLAREMKRLGYGIERRGNWWDVAGVSRALVEKFSRRTAEVEAATRRTSHRGSANELLEGRIETDLRPGRKARLQEWETRLAAEVKRLAKEAGGRITVDKDLMREAKALAMAAHAGRVREIGAELGD